MRWLLLCMCVCSGAAAVLPLLPCNPPRCQEQGGEMGWFLYDVEGNNTIEINYDGQFYLDCRNDQKMESRAMPRLTSEFQTSEVSLVNCYPPGGSVSYVDALAALNVKLQATNGETTLEIRYYNDIKPEFTSHQFAGLEFLTNLTIATYGEAFSVPAGLFSGLKNLRSLTLTNIVIDDGELQHLPHSLKKLELTGASMKTVPDTYPEAVFEVVQALPGLVDLTLDTSFVTFENMDKKKTKQQQNSVVKSSSLESLTLRRWREKSLKPLEQCDRLRKFQLSQSSIEVLPEQFVAACPQLERLEIDKAYNLTMLPAKLLHGASSLKELTIATSSIHTLPEGFLQGSPNLINLDLSMNANFETLPSGFFLGTSLKSLTLSANNLKTEVLTYVGQLTSLTYFDAQLNPFENSCDNLGYSPLRNLTQLKTLNLMSAGSDEICNDWRENLIHLERLDLDMTKPLTFKDFQYKRDPAVKNSVASTNLAYFRFIFTEDDYKKAKTAPTTDATMKVSLDCNCEAYWLRKAMDIPSRPVKVDGSCLNGKKLVDLTPEQLCSKV